MEIESTQFEIDNLRLLSASHEVFAKVTGNIVEFIFKSINLDPGGHGNILLKTPTKNTLLANNIVRTQANIYFDYNFPIETNIASTTFLNTLNTPEYNTDISIVLMPNPLKGKAKIKANSYIKNTTIYDVQGRLLMSKISNSKEMEIDLSLKTDGIYFAKVITQHGIKIIKIIKSK